MKHHASPRLLSLVLAVVMALSLLSVAAFAVDASFDYAHLEIGAVTGRQGDTVKIPVYIKGIKEGQNCRGVDAKVVLGENLTAGDVEWTDLVSGFGYRIYNKDSGYLNASDIMNSGFRITADGKICDLLVKIADNATSVGDVSLTKVSISGETATDFLNSTDGTMTNRNQDAVVNPTDENGNAISVITVKQVASFTMKVEADKDSVTAGEDVTVTVKVEGGDFVGAAAKLSYDSSKFKIKTADASTGWSKTSNGYAYYNVASDQNSLLGTFVFTAIAQTEEVTGAFTLSDTYCEETWEDGASTKVATSCANNGKVDVTIALKNDMEVTAENKTVTYNGNEHQLDPVTSSVADASVSYGRNEGDYSLTVIPSYTDAGSYTLYYKVTAPGYEAKTGSYTLTIKQAEIQYTVTPYDGVYTGAAHGVTVNVTDPTVGVTISYSEEENGTYSADCPTQTEVGEKKVYVRINAGANYKEVTVGVTIKVTAATIEFAIDPYTNVIYDGTAHTSAQIRKQVPNDVTVTYKWTTEEGEQTSNEIPSFTNADTYTVSYTVTRDNYTAVEGSYEFTIGKGTITGYVVEAVADVNYDGEAHASAVVTEGTPADATITYSYDGKTYPEIPKFTEIGSYTVSYTISAGSNYNDITDTYAFNIKEGILSDVSGTDYSGEYGGQAQTITVTAPEDATVTYSETEDGEYSTTAPTLTDVGTKTVYWKVAKTGYTTVTGSNTITITEKTVTITIDAKEKLIGDADPEFTATVTGLVNNDDLGTITYTRNPGETAGKYEISASFTENANYDVTVVTNYLTITAPAFVVEMVEDYVTGYSLVLVYTNSNATFTYDGAAMYDVTSAGYKPENSEETYIHVYALVVEGEAAEAKVAAGTTPVIETLNCSDLDVNKSGSVDLRDAVAVVAVYNANETYMTKYMSIVLEADVNHDKRVDSLDFGKIKAEYLK